MDFFGRIKDGEKKTQDLISGFMLDEPDEEIIEEEFVENEDINEDNPEEEEEGSSSDCF